MLPTPSFLLDENLPSKLAKRFVDVGYVATSTLLCGLSGQPDHIVFRYARAHQLTIITSDSDFLRTSNFPPPHAGIIVLKFPPKTRISVIIAELLAVLPAIVTLDLTDHTFLLESGQLLEQP